MKISNFLIIPLLFSTMLSTAQTLIDCKDQWSCLLESVQSNQSVKLNFPINQIFPSEEGNAEGTIELRDKEGDFSELFLKLSSNDLANLALQTTLDNAKSNRNSIYRMLVGFQEKGILESTNIQNEITCSCEKKRIQDVLSLWSLGSFDINDLVYLDCHWNTLSLQEAYKKKVKLLEFSPKIKTLQAINPSIINLKVFEFNLLISEDYYHYIDEDIPSGIAVILQFKKNYLNQFEVEPKDIKITSFKDDKGKDLMDQALKKEFEIIPDWVSLNPSKEKVERNNRQSSKEAFTLPIKSSISPNPKASFFIIEGEAIVDSNEGVYETVEKSITVGEDGEELQMAKNVSIQFHRKWFGDEERSFSITPRYPIKNFSISMDDQVIYEDTSDSKKKYSGKLPLWEKEKEFTVKITYKKLNQVRLPFLIKSGIGI